MKKLVHSLLVSLLVIAASLTMGGCFSCEKTVAKLKYKHPECFTQDTIKIIDSFKIEAYRLDTFFEWSYFTDTLKQFDSSRVAILEDSIKGLTTKVRVTKKGIEVITEQKPKIIIRKIAFPVVIAAKQEPFWVRMQNYFFVFIIGFLFGIIGLYLTAKKLYN